MLGLSLLGAIHTAISLVAVAAGIVALVRDKEIDPTTRIGKLYIHTTILTCLTGFGIFHHGGFGPPHMLGIITLAVLGIAYKAGKGRWFGRGSRYVETVSYSLTFFFHMIPGFTETATRLPVGKPLVASQEDPALQAAIGGVFLVFLVGAALQVWRIRSGDRALATSAVLTPPDPT